VVKFSFIVNVKCFWICADENEFIGAVLNDCDNLFYYSGNDSIMFNVFQEMVPKEKCQINVMVPEIISCRYI
jgi:hypothetical protein